MEHTAGILVLTLPWSGLRFEITYSYHVITALQLFSDKVPNSLINPSETFMECLWSILLIPSILLLTTKAAYHSIPRTHFSLLDWPSNCLISYPSRDICFLSFGQFLNCDIIPRSRLQSDLKGVYSTPPVMLPELSGAFHSAPRVLITNNLALKSRSGVSIT